MVKSLSTEVFSASTFKRIVGARQVQRSYKRSYDKTIVLLSVGCDPYHQAGLEWYVFCGKGSTAEV